MELDSRRRYSVEEAVALLTGSPKPTTTVSEHVNATSDKYCLPEQNEEMFPSEDGKEDLNIFSVNQIDDIVNDAYTLVKNVNEIFSPRLGIPTNHVCFYRIPKNQLIIPVPHKAINLRSEEEELSSDEMETEQQTQNRVPSTDVQEDLNETNHEEVCTEHVDENIETRNELHLTENEHPAETDTTNNYEAKDTEPPQKKKKEEAKFSREIVECKRKTSYASASMQAQM